MRQDKPAKEIPLRLRDGRDAGEWESSYDASALTQIYIELTYLLVLLFGSLYLLYSIALDPLAVSLHPSEVNNLQPDLSEDQKYWLAVSLGRHNRRHSLCAEVALSLCRKPYLAP